MGGTRRRWKRLLRSCSRLLVSQEGDYCCRCCPPPPPRCETLGRNWEKAAKEVCVWGGAGHCFGLGLLRSRSRVQQNVPGSLLASTDRAGKDTALPSPLQKGCQSVLLPCDDCVIQAAKPGLPLPEVAGRQQDAPSQAQLRESEQCLF